MLFCVYLVYDTQKVLGQFQNEYTLDDTYLAALFLYTDIIQIFIRLIRILNTLQNNWFHYASISANNWKLVKNELD